MIKWFEKLFGIERLKKENEELRKKLLERQQVINKTNAYWKSVVKNMKKGKS
jgi:hypothetical protein